MNSNETEVNQDAVAAAEAAAAIAQGQIEEAVHPEGIEMVEWCFTNDKSNPAIRQIFHMFHTGAFANKIGVMHAKVRDKDEIHTVICGVQIDGDQVLAFPIAKLLTQEEQDQYLAPTGDGSYVGL